MNKPPTTLPSRRQIVRATLAGAAALPLALRPGALGAAPATARGAAPATARGADKAPGKGKLRLLILGGTAFLGPQIVEEALRRGHTITLFNRGKTRPDLFPGVEKLHGDRNDKLDALADPKRRWDAVIDTSGYVPRHVSLSAKLLADRVTRYLFVSTVSVYADTTRANMDESAPLATLADPATEKVTPETYGALKAACEAAASAAMPGRVANVRPGLIVGPEDPTDRFTYWPARAARGGDMMAPGAPSDPILFVDVRDLGTFLVDLAERQTVGTMNALGPEKGTTIGALVDASVAAARAAAKAPAKEGAAPVVAPRSVTWVDSAFLEAHKVAPWGDMPVWVPPEGEGLGMGTMSRARAVAAGLRFRPVADTVRDTLTWWQSLPAERRAKPRAGLSPAREAEVLEAWRKRQGSKGTKGG